MELEGLGEALAKIGKVKETIANKANSPLEIGITRIANVIVKQFQLSLASAGVEAGSSLYSSIYATEAVLTSNGAEISIRANDYWDFINSGVDGFNKSAGAVTNKDGSTYSFKTAFPNRIMAESIQGWMSLRGIGTAKDFKSMSYGIATKVKQEGIEPNNFVNNTLTPQFIQEISLSLGKEIGEEITLSIKNL